MVPVTLLWDSPTYNLVKPHTPASCATARECRGRASLWPQRTSLCKEPSASHGEIATEFEVSGSVLDLQSMARSHRGMRSLVGAAAVAFLFLAGFECADVVGRVLRFGAVL